MVGMTVVRAVLMAVAGALTCALLRAQKPEFRMAVSVAAGLLVLMWSMDGIGEGVEAVRDLTGQSGLPEDAASLLLRATGIAVIAEFGAQLCRDADESALAGRVELAGRAALLGLAAPLLAGLSGRLTALIP